MLIFATTLHAAKNGRNVKAVIECDVHYGTSCIMLSVIVFVWCHHLSQIAFRQFVVMLSLSAMSFEMLCADAILQCNVHHDSSYVKPIARVISGALMRNVLLEACQTLMIRFHFYQFWVVNPRPDSSRRTPSAKFSYQISFLWWILGCADLFCILTDELESKASNSRIIFSRI